MNQNDPAIGKNLKENVSITQQRKKESNTDEKDKRR